MMKTEETYSDKIKILCDCDLKMGIAPEKIKRSINYYASLEKYEVCAGLKRSLDEYNKQHEN